MRYAALILSLVVLGVSGGLHAQPSAAPACLAVVDDLHLEFRSTPALRLAVGQLLTGLAQDGVYCSVATTRGTEELVAPVSLQTTQAAVSRLIGTALRPSDVMAASPQSTVEVASRAQAAYAATARAIAAVARERSGRPFPVFFFSGGYTVGIAGTNDLVRAALAAGAPVHAIDPRGFGTASQNPGLAPDDWNAYLTATRASLTALAVRTQGSVVVTEPEFGALQSRFRTQ